MRSAGRRPVTSSARAKLVRWPPPLTARRTPWLNTITPDAPARLHDLPILAAHRGRRSLEFSDTDSDLTIPVLRFIIGFGGDDAL